MVKYFDEVLQEIGWSNGFNIPIANEENKALEAEFERLLARKNELTAKVSKLNERTANLKEHSANIQKQESEAQFLITTSNKQLTDLTEQNVLLEKECEAIQRNTVKLNKEKKDLEERYNNLQKIVSKTVTQIDRLKKTVLVDSEALKMWENALKQSVDDNEIIKSYSKEDLQRIKDLELRRSKACEEVVERRKTVDKMVTQITMLELVVEKTSAMYKQALAERKRLINQWSNTVKQLRQRDSDIIKAKEEIQVLREVIKNKKESLDDEKQFLKNQLKNNKETEHRIAELNKELNEKRQKKKDIIQRIHDYTNELDIQKREMEMISNDTVNERKWKKALLKEKEETINRLKKLKEEIEEIKLKTKDFDENAHLANSRVHNLQAIVEERQKAIKKLEQDILNIESANYRTQKSLNELIEEEKLYVSESKNIEARIRTLEKEKDNLDTELLKSREITYNIEYKLTKMTSKIQKIEQERENKISKEDADRIKELQDELEEKNKQNEIIQAQLLSFNDEIKNMNIAIEKTSAELEKIRDKVLEKKLLIEGGEKQEKVVQLRCQQLQVEENLLKLQVAQVQKMLQHQRDELYSLEKTQVEFEAAVNERKLEIDLQKDMLLVQKRGLSEDIGKLKQESKERLIKLDQYKKRYDISLSLLGKDEDGEPLSVTHFKIKYAQEKYMMQQEGDELDEKIRKAEREILAMENTLKIMNVANEAYKKKLKQRR